MEARPTELLSFLGKSQNFQFVIPVYQRMYSWDIGHCVQLWDDIMRVGGNENVLMHFIGSIMYIGDKHSQTAINQLSVIDGQQRLTTITLLLIALSEFIGENDDILEKFSKTKIKNRYLINPDEKNEKRYKLILSQTDKDSLISLIDGKALPKENSLKIIENFEFFKYKLQENKEKLELVCKGINKLSIIDIALDREKDEAQLIFESMNSTGKDLTQTDLMRNYILMDLPPERQTHLYERYWREMELKFGQEYYGDKFDFFVRDYLTIKNNGKVPVLRKIYDSFKEYHQENNLNVESLLDDLRKYARYYCNMALKQESDKELLSAFDELSRLEADVVYPFLLRLYDDYAENRLNKADFIHIVRMTESYIFRRAVCGMPTNALNKIFATFANTINTERYLESVLARFCTLGSNSFPNDELFKENLVSKELYTKFKRTNYLLSKLENFERKERVDINEYTIEHIMPQNIENNPTWQEALGENYEQIHEKYLHSLGNLTLTGYNCEYSNRAFLEKRDMKGGFKESPLRLNDFLRDLNTFGENEIVARADELAQKALKIWQYPNIDKEILANYKGTKEKSQSPYTIDNHKFLIKNGKSKKLFDELRSGILALDENVREEVLKLYIAYKFDTNFVDIIPQAERLKLSINIYPKDLDDPKEMAKDISSNPRGQWGNGKVEVMLQSLEELPYCLGLIRQALEQQQ